MLAPPSIPIYEPDLGGATAPDETLPTTGGVTAPDEPVVSEPPVDPEAVTPAPTVTDPATLPIGGQTTDPATTTPVGQPASDPATGAGTSGPAPASGGAAPR